MNIIAVVDNRYGLMFHHRRLSSDRVLTRQILALAKGSVLRMNSYTAGFFEKLPANTAVSDHFLEQAGPEDFCLVENTPVSPYAADIATFYLYCWNRDYPSDFKLDFIPADHGMKLLSSEDFPGYSHEKITREIYQY